MSRRPDNKAAQNQQTIKSLLKLEANKTCADCKKNKHPRWASWNLGVFVCIRCSGIHRGMGTHISRVKSVDLDAWTDDQLQSVLRWGNGRANKYWEAKLAPGHTPSDAKIENFIRTKYESKRWVMDGPMPDPSTLDDGGGGDDNVPLNVVREKVQLDRSASQRASSASGSRGSIPGPQRQAAPSFDLIGGDDPTPPPPRPNTTDTPSNTARGPPPPKPSTPSQLLGGLDFLGAPADRPSSAGSKSPGMSRPDLKQSILSLYANAPANPQSPPGGQASHDRQPSFGGMASPPAAPISAGGIGGMNDAFAGLNFGSTSTAPPTAKPPQPSQPLPPASKPPQPLQSPNYAALAGLTSPSTQPKAPSAVPQMTSPPLTGGGFFDAGPKPPPKPAAPKSSAAPPLAVRKVSNASDGFGDFSSAMNTAPAATSTNNAASNSSGLLDFTKQSVDIQPVSSTTTNTDSVFNLSSNSSQQPPSQASAPSGQVNYASKLSTDPWGGNEWATPAPAPATKQQSIPSPPTASSNNFGWGSATNTTSSMMQNEWNQPASTSNAGANTAGGWGGALDNAWSANTPAQPTVAAEEDFGGWSSNPAPVSAPAPMQPQQQQQPKSFGASEDLFSNVWG